jgi:hypothetical protein
MRTAEARAFAYETVRGQSARVQIAKTDRRQVQVSFHPAADLALTSRSFYAGSDSAILSEVRALAVTPEIVPFARSPALDQHGEPGGMVVDVEPVAHIGAIAIYRQRQAVERLENHLRDGLLGKLAYTVIVGAIRDRVPTRRRLQAGLLQGAYRHRESLVAMRPDSG